MTGDGNSQQFFNRCLDFLETGIAKLKYRPIFKVDKVVVLLEFEGTLKLRTVVPELMFGYQVTVLQQFNGIVQSGTAYPVLVIFHLEIKGFDIEMPFSGVNFFQYGETFRCLPVPVTFKIFGKYFFYRIKIKAVVVSHKVYFIVPKQVNLTKINMKGIWNALIKFRIKVKKFLLLFGINKNNVAEGGLKTGVACSGNHGRGLLPGDSRCVDPRNIIYPFYLPQPRH